MDHYADRGYRLKGPEVRPVMELVRSRLSELDDAREDLIEAEILFRVLYSLVTYQAGRPVYPEPVT